MPVHAHRLRADRDAAFLREGRADPFSRTRLQQGATVVRCAGCGTAFLRESWDALGGRHCGQTDTLQELIGAASRAAPAPPVATAPLPAPPPATAYLPPEPERRRRGLVPWLIVGALALATVLALAWFTRGGPEESDDVAGADSAEAVVPTAVALRVGSIDGRLQEGDETTDDGRFRDTYTFETRGRGPFVFSVDG